MKRLLLIPLVIIMVIGVILSSCAEEAAPAPAAPAPAAPAAPKPAAPAPAAPAPAAPAPAAPAPAAPTKAAPYGTIRSAGGDFGQESTDPVFYESLWGWAFYDSLLRWDINGNIIPGVADSWSIDGNVYTFKIHKGIKFHNGDPLTAADVKFSVDRFGDMTLSKNPWSYYISALYNKKDSKVVDEYTFQFVADHPEPSQLIIFAWTRILPKAYYEKVGMDAFRKQPIGSGPWKFKELISKTKLTLEANTDYWRPDEIPAYKYYVEYSVPEAATRIAMAKTGEADIAVVDFDRIPDLQKEGFNVEKVGPPGTSSVCIQGSWLPDAGPMGDIRVRQAMSYALNRQEISDTWYHGFAKPGGQFYMYPGSFGWDDRLATDPYDPAKAKALLAEAGYPAKFKDPTIHVYTTSFGQDYHLMLINYWKNVGLQVKLDVVDTSIFNKYFFSFVRLKGGEPNVGWIFTWTYDAFFNCTYHSANMYSSIGVHNTGNDAKADELYKKAASELDSKKSAQYFADFQVYVRSLYVNIGIVQYDVLRVYNPKTLGKWVGRDFVSYYDGLNGIQHPAK